MTKRGLCTAHQSLKFDKNQKIIMAKKDRIQMPQSTAGLIRYFDESQEAIKIKPEYVVAVCVLIIGALLLLRFV